MKRTIGFIGAGLVGLAVVTGCTSAADMANENLSKAAENFEVPRRIVGINGITDKVLFSVEGFCSIENDGRKLDVTCKVDKAGNIERTTLGLSDNVTYVSTQMAGVKVDIFRPETIVPNFELSTSN
jgi:hypothetical protein